MISIGGKINYVFRRWVYTTVLKKMKSELICFFIKTFFSFFNRQSGQGYKYCFNNNINTLEKGIEFVFFNLESLGKSKESKVFRSEYKVASP